MTIFSPLKQIRNNIENIGIDETIDSSDRKHITLHNTLAFTTSLIVIGYVPFLFRYLPESRIILYIVLAQVPLNLSILLLNYLKHYLIARVYSHLFCVITFVTISLLAGVEMNMHLYLLLPIMVAFFLYPDSQKRIMYTMVVIALGSFVGLEIWFLNHNGILKPSLAFVRTMATVLNTGLIVFIVGFSFYIYTIYSQAEKGLRDKQEEADALLLNILPKEIASILKHENRVIADQFDSVSILFADIVNFTPMSAKMTPTELVELLNEVFSCFDTLVEKYGLEKIKTIGDCYMVAAGVPRPRSDHAHILTRFALDIRDYVSQHEFRGKRLALRVGLNSGPVVAGVIGHMKFSYDLWGDAVNTASRMESHGTGGFIQIAETTYGLIKDDFICEPRGVVSVKGKGEMNVWYVLDNKI